jgi:DNA-binding MarR family transcriptional regulator
MSEQSLSEREWALWRAFALMSRQLTGAVDQRLRDEAGISSADFEILHALAGNAHHRARSRELAQMLTWEKSRISHQVSRMVDRGLVHRTECDTDMRGMWVELAPAGREALETALPGYQQELYGRFTSLMDDAEATAFVSAALKVIKATDPDTCQVEIARIQRDTAPTPPPASHRD